MTINEAEQQPQAEAVVTAGPGALLRGAREARGWTQAEVARRLNLRLAVIESIDNDQYKAGVAVTFLRGYVKAYAKVVGVDVQQALAAFDGMSGAEQIRAAAPMQSFSKKTRQQANDNWLKRISWLVLLGLLASLVYWWWQDSGANYVERTLEPMTQQEEPASLLPEPVSPSDETPEIIIPPLPSEAMAEPAADTGAEVESPGSSVDTAASDVELPAVAAAPAAEAAPVATTAEPEAGSPAEPAANPRLLAMRFTDDCWIQVTDSRGRVLAEGVKKANESLSLEGEPPFRLILGAPRAASVEYMNQAVDLSSFNAGRVARLTVPQS
ncbi:cytoskeleton protein RodZ [Zobellella iuensis]|uniref:Cytoskeleton protein RodZ n=1 Tax=Zobellella iuensis TaxID=2803811 RepID=A0ABS1QUU1_9GAMM|nr:cytoskeleton protein RodZ [Zobellella iuensis]MBL1378645.1 cytoskeleton protein RodZ [Zobellella iuensis]